MSHPFLERLTRKRPFLLDTGLSTELERRGATLDPRLWSSRLLLDAPELIVSVHLDNLSAGAQVITTATYQASFEGFAEVLGLSRNASRDLMARSVELARQAVRLHLERTPVSLPPAIAGSLGPYGAFLADGSEFRGDYVVDPVVLRDHHAPRIEALLDAGVDVIAFETLPRRDEALVVAELLDQLACPAAWISFSTRSSQELAGGDSLEQTARDLCGARHVSAIGLNCCPPSRVSPALEVLRSATSQPLLVKPNSGEEWVDGVWSASSEAESIPALVEDWLKRGVLGVGGCCRTRPELLRILSRTGLFGT
ncbi:MAG TPA: homocysteine S-methyltransferase [Planctomycetes bacterium]|nr:homocysteine S-methyltransferase [Planctomycetota bacterium]